jgi:hypothetical protein
MITKEDLTKRIAAAMVARDSLRKTASRNVAAATKNNALLEFQKTDSNLTADGFYGPNSKAALAWYLQTTKDNVVPDVNPKFAKSAKTGQPIPVTWKAPELAKTPEATKPAPVATKTAPTTSKPASTSTLKPASKPTIATASKPISKSAKKKKKKKKKGPDIASLSKSLGKAAKFGQEVLSQNIDKVDAEEVIAAVASGAPKIKKALKTMDAESNIAREFAKIQSKGLKGIKKTLLRGALQKDATSEHRSLAKRDNFRQTVLSQLKDIRSQLAAKKAGKGGGEDYRIVGLLL